MTWRIGTAGWSIASQYVDRFPETGFALERYAHRFTCVDVNSSFYRPHRPATWTRWAAIVPDAFRFAVKVPRAITHERRLRECGDLITRLLDETAGLSAERLGVYAASIERALSEPQPPWCIFDNCAAMAAMGDAFELARQLDPHGVAWLSARSTPTMESRDARDKG